MGCALAVLAVWRVAHLLSQEDGPFDAIARIRRALGNGFFGSLLDCFYCLSIWVAAPFAYWLGRTWMEGIVIGLALSGGACLLYKATERDAGTKEKA